MLYLLTVENCPTHDKKKIEQSGCSVLLSNHYYIMLVFMINCKTIFLYMNLSSSLFKYGFLDMEGRKIFIPCLEEATTGRVFLPGKGIVKQSEQMGLGEQRCLVQQGGAADCWIGDFCCFVVLFGKHFFIILFPRRSKPGNIPGACSYLPSLPRCPKHQPAPFLCIMATTFSGLLKPAAEE